MPDNDMPTFKEAEGRNPFSLARGWGNGDPGYRGSPGPTARDELGELAAMAALIFWLRMWLPGQIHSALRAGATLEQVAAATELDVAGVVAAWREWSDGQRHLLLTCPHMPDINAEHDRVAELIRAQVDGKP